MKVLDVVQGTQAWLDVRAKHFTASESPAMMGVSKYMTRAELLRQKATGITPDVDANKQRLFDRGHEAEAAARQIVEELLCEELYPATITKEIDGIPLLASFDGLTMSYEKAWETKLWNEALAAAVEAESLEPHYCYQMEQQILVSGADGVYFTVSDGTPERTKGFWYKSNPELRQKLIAGWRVFAEDLANYQHVEVAPAVTVAPIDDLPALTVEITGSVTSSNLVTFKGAVMARIQAINTDLQTDEDFAIAEKTVTFLDDGEKRLDLVKSQALAQTASIDELFRTIDALKGEMKAKRLTLDKLVKARKDSIRVEIMQGAKDAFAAHIISLNQRLGKLYMDMSAGEADFAGVMKNKRTISSLRDAVSTELARVKIAANEIADKIQVNLGTLRELAKDHKFLFSDAAQIVMKAPDDLTALVKLRISEHKEAEDKRLTAERERIRQEEEAKARAKADADAAADRQRIAAEERAKIEREQAEADSQAKAVAKPSLSDAAWPFPPVSSAPEDAAPMADTGKTMKLGDMNALFGFTITADFLASLGFQPLPGKGVAKTFRECDLPAICSAISKRVLDVARNYQSMKEAA